MEKQRDYSLLGSQRIGHVCAGFLVFLLLCLYAFPSQSRGQYEVEEEQPFWLRGLLDVRIARGGRAPSWMDRGSGKTRYGGRATPEGLNKITRFALSQLALEAGGTLPWGLMPRVQINLETAMDDEDRPLLIEASLRKEWGAWEQGWGVQSGVLPLPFSLEHTGPAWTPQYTLSASALNNWLWEESRTVGIEGEWWRVFRGNLRIGVLAGLGLGTDQVGWLLAERGWVLSDYLSGVNGDLPLPRRGVREEIFSSVMADRHSTRGSP